MSIVADVLWWLGFTIAMTEFFGVRPLMCGCRAGFQAYRHLKSLWLFVVGAAYVLSGVFDAADGNKLAVIIAVVGVYYLWRWWRHTKNQRKKLKDKVLGVVRETAAGLKVVPVPSGGAA